MDYLARTISYPLEREYEAWIVQHMEKYFATFSVRVRIFAVSPLDEATWPADESLQWADKLVGIQFKRPSPELGSRQNDFTRLHWDLSNPPGQMELVVQNPDIYYCLPTFLNRDARENALHHCLLWRPENSDHKSAWYDNSNPRVRTEHSSIGNAQRWGWFAEKFLSCSLGRSLVNPGFSGFMRPVGESARTLAIPESMRLYVVALRREARR